MNKKGFTLIEIIVSIVLVSLVMTSLLATLVQIKDAQTIVHENSNAIIYSSSISRILNNDIIENNGIRYLNCGERNSNSSCDIILGNNKKRRLEIEYVKKETNEVENAITNKTTESYKIYTTLKYYEVFSNEEKLLYIKTLTAENSQIENNAEITSNNIVFSTKIEDNIIELDSKSTGMQDIVSTITINLVSEDKNKETYEFTIVSAGTFDENDPKVGNSYKISFNNDDVELAEEDNSFYQYFYEYYNMGYKESKSNDKAYITKVTIPSISGLEYYTKKNGEGIKVIDSNGNILVGPTFFDGDTEIYAHVAE